MLWTLPVRDCRRGRNDFSSDRNPPAVNLDNFKFKFVDKYSSRNFWITISNIYSKQQKCHPISEGWLLVATIEQFCSFASEDRAGQLPKFCADPRTLQSQNFEPEFFSQKFAPLSNSFQSKYSDRCFQIKFQSSFVLFYKVNWKIGYFFIYLPKAHISGVVPLFMLHM